MEPYLYHGIKWNNYDLMIKILKNGYILPRCMQNEEIKDDFNLFNGTKYISLSQKTLIEDDREIYRVAYDNFIYNKPMFVLDYKNIDIIYPNIFTTFDKDMMSVKEWQNMLHNDDEQRYSDYCDEVQTKDKISLKKSLLALGLPMKHLEDNYTNEDIKKFLNNLKRVLEDNKINVPVINSSIYDCADDMEHIKKYSLYM